MLNEFFSVLADPRFYGFCCVLVCAILLTKIVGKLILIVISPIGYLLSRWVWKYLCNRYDISYPLYHEFGGNMQESSVSNGKKIKMVTAYATNKGVPHASLTWLFLMCHSPLAVIEVCCHEYAHLYLGHVQHAVYSRYDPWNEEREADTWSLYAMRNMPLLLKICGILFRGDGLYWNPYTKEELSMAPAQDGAPSFILQRSLYDCFGIDYRGVFSKRRRYID